jgi:vacuolar protein sorting-associated protein 26
MFDKKSAKMLGLFQANPTCEIQVSGNPDLVSYRDRVTTKGLPAYRREDKVTGHLSLIPPSGKTIKHQGIVLSVYGDFQGKDGDSWSRFYERVQYLAPPGDLLTTFSTDFSFDRLQFPTASYYGQYVDAVYGIEVKVIRRLKDFLQSSSFIVFFFETTTKEQPIHNEIGMTGVLHIEFIFSHGSYDCQDVVIGAAYMLLVKLRVVHMQISLYCVENYQRGAQVVKRNIIKSIEIMDGAPVRGESIPIRFFLGDCNIWPWSDFPGSALKIEWYLRAQLIDENGKKYYKRLRVLIVRKPPATFTSEIQ